ncbi:hypothetical protein CEK28_13860 [Xenophilus sp. AP218F]|nr:hypothetical protein [Chromobacterium sp. ASV5]OWY38014.1 hypothetical protein CEK28_13860 [Xenophilus sp. AP218F]
MAVPIKTPLRRATHAACGVVILSRLSCRRERLANGQTLRQRRQLARVRTASGRGGLPQRPWPWREWCRRLIAYFRRWASTSTL